VEVFLVFLVSGRESAEVFEFGEASFDAVSLFVKVLIVLPLHLPVRLRRDDRHRAHVGDMLDDRIAVIALVGQDVACLPLSQQRDRLRAVVGLSCRHDEVHRQSVLVGQQVDLGRQTSSGTPQSLVVAPFLRPVAAC
jgi:hypothetical protein